MCVKSYHELSYYQHSNLTSTLEHRYGDAQKFLDDPTLKGDVANSVRLLHGVAQKLRAKRIRAGALQLASPEVRSVRARSARI